MVKKYSIVNSSKTSESSFPILNVLLTILIVIIGIWIGIIIYRNISHESFQTISTNDDSIVRKKLTSALEKQLDAQYIKNNFDLIEPSSMEQKMQQIMSEYGKVQFPSVDTIRSKDLMFISNTNELSDVVNKAKSMKNFYNVGDLVVSNSTFGIDKNKICFGSGANTGAEIGKFTECMVCSVIPDDQLENSRSWKTTRTNINKVCLFNPNVDPNTSSPADAIASMEQCKKFCKI